MKKTKAEASAAPVYRKPSRVVEHVLCPSCKGPVRERDGIGYCANAPGHCTFKNQRLHIKK